MKCIAFREARDSVAHFIIRKWFAKKLNKSVRSVSDNWNKSEEECHSDFRKCGPPFKLSQQSREIIKNLINLQKENCKTMAKEITNKRGKRVTAETVRNY